MTYICLVRRSSLDQKTDDLWVSFRTRTEQRSLAILPTGGGKRQRRPFHNDCFAHWYPGARCSCSDSSIPYVAPYLDKDYSWIHVLHLCHSRQSQSSNSLFTEVVSVDSISTSVAVSCFLNTSHYYFFDALKKGGQQKTGKHDESHSPVQPSSRPRGWTPSKAAVHTRCDFVCRPQTGGSHSPIRMHTAASCSHSVRAH